MAMLIPDRIPIVLETPATDDELEAEIDRGGNASSRVAYKAYKSYNNNMNRMAASEAREKFSDVVSRVAYKGERMVLERRGRAVAAIIPVEDLQRLEALEDEADYREAIAAEKKARELGEEPVTLDQAKRELGLL